MNRFHHHAGVKFSVHHILKGVPNIGSEAAGTVPLAPISSPKIVHFYDNSIPVMPIVMQLESFKS